jgi:hypothetical protein
VKFVELEKDMARDDKLCARVAHCSEGRERVIARKVCVNNFYFVLANEARELQRRRQIERIAKTYLPNVLLWQCCQSVKQRRVQRDGGVNIMAASCERVRQIDQMFSPPPS